MNSEENQQIVLQGYIYIQQPDSTSQRMNLQDSQKVQRYLILYKNGTLKSFFHMQNNKHQDQIDQVFQINKETIISREDKNIRRDQLLISCKNLIKQGIVEEPVEIILFQSVKQYTDQRSLGGAPNNIQKWYKNLQQARWSNKDNQNQEKINQITYSQKIQPIIPSRQSFTVEDINMDQSLSMASNDNSPFEFAKNNFNDQNDENDKNINKEVSMVSTRDSLQLMKSQFLNQEDLFYKEEVVFPDNSIYRGQMINNGDKDLRHGFGIQLWQNGANYEGYWQLGKRVGQGKFVHEDGDVYEGAVENDMANGYGVYVDAHGSVYKGEFKDNLQHGQGEEWWFNQGHFKGQYENRMKSFGVFTWPNGNSYEGQFENNQMHGEGLYIWSDSGIKYQGQFYNDLKHGQGVIKLPDGYLYEGKWLNGQYTHELQLVKNQCPGMINKRISLYQRPKPKSNRKNQEQITKKSIKMSKQGRIIYIEDELNQILKDDPDCELYQPFNLASDEWLFQQLSDGVIL